MQFLGLVFGLILLGITLFAIFINVLYYNKSTFSIVNANKNDDIIAQNKYKASIALYNASFAGRNFGDEDPDWEKKLTNPKYNIVLDKNEFTQTFFNDNYFENDKWKILPHTF